MVLAKAGGLAGLAASGPPHFFDITYTTGPGSGFTLLAMLAPAFIISPGLLQKVYGAKDPRAVRMGVGVQALVLSLFAFIPVLLGMSARVLVPDVASPNLVLPTVLVEALPVWLGALALAAVFSAEVSTCDAILFMLATSLSQDLYKQFVEPAGRRQDRAARRQARGRGRRCHWRAARHSAAHRHRRAQHLLHSAGRQPVRAGAGGAVRG